MLIDVLVAEIGSTTTIVNAFDQIKTDNPLFLGQGMAPTTIKENDVTIGLNNAIENLKNILGVTTLEARETFASSSAAGGLRMSVHGLVYNMTVKSAKEAALGAGANILYTTSGRLTSGDITEIKAINPNIIMLSGGVDYGDTETSLYNARQIASLGLSIPVIYAGNIVNQMEIANLFKKHKLENYLYLTDNVYPKIDTLNIMPTRKIIQEIFEKHITEGPGMEKIRSVINGTIIPTPGAVMEASLLLQSSLGDLLTFDVGGATTDVFSITEGSAQIALLQTEPVPFAKRSVNGDLGVYINKDNLINLTQRETITKELGISSAELVELINNYQAVPLLNQIPLVKILTKTALINGLLRHVGNYSFIYSGTGKKRIVEGKDLTTIQYVIATGGALTRLPGAEEIIKEALSIPHKNLLMPSNDVEILIDHDYIMSSIGVLAIKYPEASLKLLLKSFKHGR